MRSFFCILFLLPIAVFATNGTLKGAGTESDPWQIEDYEDLKALSSGKYLYSEHYVLTADIDATPSFGENCLDGVCNGYSPIGRLKDASRATTFTGSIDGRNHTIRNMRIWMPCNSNVAFIKSAEKASLSNLHFDSLTVISDLYETETTAGLVAIDHKSKIKNVSVKKGFVQGNREVGGLFGHTLASEFDSLSFQGKVVGRNQVGGLAGILNSDITNSFTDVDIVAYGSYVGGFAGKTQGENTNVYSKGSITLAETSYSYGASSITTLTKKYRSEIGGLVGRNEGYITFCHSSVNINGRGKTFESEEIGGLVGINVNSIMYSYATGNVSGNTEVGGLVGWNETLSNPGDYGYGYIEHAYAWGSVMADSNAAGLVGLNSGSIHYAYSIGKVTAINKVDALATGNVDSSYWNMETSGVTSSEMGVGLTSEQMTHLSSFDGWGDCKIAVDEEFCTLEDEILTETRDGGSIRYCKKSVWGNADGKTFPTFTMYNNSFKELVLVAAPTASAKWTEEPVVSVVNADDVVPFGRWTNFNTENAAGDSIYYGYQIGYKAGKDTVWGAFSHVAVPNALTISSYDELQKIGHHEAYPLSGHYTLTADIDGSGKLFDPIGSMNEPFTGTFEGKNHVIKNLTINKPLGDNVGLFSALSYARLTDLTFENAKVNGSWLVGVAAGRVQNSYVKNVVSYNGSVVGDTYVGGVFGHLNGNDHVSQVGATGSVTGVELVGGVAGELYGGLLQQAFSASIIKGLFYVGGIIGHNWEGRIQESYSASIIKGRESLGGIHGHEEYNVRRDTLCYFDKSLSLGTEGDSARTTSQMLTKANYSLWDFENVWNIKEGESYPYLKGSKPILPGQLKDDGSINVLVGEGTADKPYLISNYDDLKYIGRYEYATDLYYMLEKNIVAGGSDDLFEPIKDFSGVFLGNGKTISKLVIDQGSQDTVGLFKTLMTGATVSNLHLDTIKVSGRNYVGGLAGVDFGANIDSVDVLVQMNAEKYAGAIAGEKSGGRLSLSSAVGSIVAKEYAGGLFGNLKNAKVNDALSFVYVSGDKYLGGLVGNASNTDVSNSFTAGKVVGSEDVGVIVGASDKSTWTSVYGDSTVWNFSKNAGGNLKNTPQLVHQETYENMDFDKTWKIAEGYGYPYLKWSSRSNNVFGDSITVLDGSGTDEDPYIIRTSQDLRSIGYSIYTLDRVYRLVNDITMSAETNNRAYKESIGHQGKVTSKWLPDLSIASGKIFNTKFSGKFLGGGHTITGLCAVYDFSPGVGFIDTLAETGIVDSLSLVNFKTTNNAQWSGAVVVNYGTIKNVSIDGALLGVNVGGVAGNNYGTIQDCYVTGNVVADSVAGGIAAENWGTIDNCVVENINARGYKAVGGIAGIEHKTTTNTKVSGEVFSIESYAGGAFGIIDGASVSNVTAACSVQVAIPTKSGIMGGGFVGLNNGTISKSSAVGNLRNASGFVGTNMSIIEDCFATGDVKDASGFVSYNHGTISRSYSTGNIEWMTFPSNVLGGFAMQNFSDGMITDVYSTGSITLNNSGSVTANILVAVQSGTLKNAFATGSVDIAGQSAFCGNRSWEKAGENIYFNSDKCQLPDSVGNMIALSEKEMVHHQNFEGFDFKKVWTIDEGVSYPTIRLGDTTTVESPESALYVYDSGIVTSSMTVRVNGSLADVRFWVAQPGNVKLDLLDIRGRFVLSTNLGSLAVGDYYKTLNIASLTKGRYIVTLRVNNRMTERSFVSKK